MKKPEKAKFDFYKFLDSNGYEKEVIRNREGKIMVTNYQKKVGENEWNALTIHEDRLMSCASVREGLFMVRKMQPTNEIEAKNLLDRMEELPTHEDEI